MREDNKHRARNSFLASFSLTALCLAALFGAVAFLWDQPEGRQAGKKAQGVPVDEDEDGKSRILNRDKRNVLCTVLDGETPVLTFVLGLSPREKSITLLCLPQSLTTTGTGEKMMLHELYGYAGDDLICQCVEEAAGITIDRRISLGVNGARQLIDTTGALRYEAAYTVTADYITVAKGDRVLDGAKSFAYLKGLSMDGSLSEEELLTEQGRFLMEFFRQNYTPDNAGRVLKLYDELFPLMKTDLTLKDMVGFAPVIEAMQDGAVVTLFFVKGERDGENGGVTLTDKCVEKIGEIFGT